MESSLKHMESSLDPLAIVSTELKVRNKSATLKKFSPTTMIMESIKHLHGNTRLVRSPLIIDGF
jgi:hypothetical protein